MSNFLPVPPNTTDADRDVLRKAPKPPLKRITYRPQPWVEGTANVWLRPTDHGADEWEVYADEEGTDHLGRVGKYQGTLDRPISRGSRIVHRGKTRTLWSYREPPNKHERYPRASWGNYSRADCIRALVHWRQLRKKNLDRAKGRS